MLGKLIKILKVRLERPVEIAKTHLFLVFFISGFASLIYQVVWQRVLFTVYGVNIESITIIVSIFMLGLGFGSFAGGRFSKKYPEKLIHGFVVAEICIGLFGLISLGFIQAIASLTGGSSLILLAISVMLTLFFPTLFMGATLPILVTYLNRSIKNTGASVASLYFINTIGAAVSAILTVMFLFEHTGQSGAVRIAALFNFGVVLYVLLLILFAKFLPNAEKFRITFPVVLLLSGAQGFVALSYEILWMRVFSFSTGSLPHVFGIVLGVYLVGIASGSLFVKRFVNKDTASLTRITAHLFLVSNLISFMLIPFLGKIAGFSESSAAWGLLPVFLASFFFGGIFPLLSRIGILSHETVGEKVSFVYLANIIGSTAGSFLTGFVFLDIFPLASTSIIISISGLVLSAFVYLYNRTWGGRFAGAAVSVFLIITVARVAEPLHKDIYEKLIMSFRVHHKREFPKGRKLVRNIENRHGVINMDNTGVVYGNGMYDGVFNISPLNTRNDIFRAYLPYLYNSNAKRILVIGLATGSWAQVAVNFPQVEEAVIVEINDGYLQLIAENKEVKSLLTNPKVKIITDDGRRFLANEKNGKWDLILMNTTYYWRASATNLLSSEFLQMAKSRLNPNGLIYFNITGSMDVLKTAVSVYPDFATIPIGKYQYSMFIGSPSPFNIDRASYARLLRGLIIDGKTIFNGTVTEGVFSYLRNHPLYNDKKAIEKETRNAKIITDDNMAVEYRYWKNIAETADKIMLPLEATLKSF